MSEAVAYNSFAVQAGQDINLDFTITDSAGSAVNLNGATVRFAAARTVGSTPVLDTTASPQTATITFSSPISNTFTASIKDTDSDGLRGDYYYEVKITDSSGNEAISNRGIITFEQALT